MKKILKQAAIFSVVAGVATVVGTDVFAATSSASDGGGSTSDYKAGSSLLKDFEGNLKGTMGTTVGLGISLIGLYMWIWNQVSWGIFIAIGGALITAFPDIFTNLSEGSKSAFKSTTSS